MSTQNDPMAEIRASFFVECEELLEALQDSLQIMDDGAEDGETINVVFRAVHSIKGGAGAFGLDALVRFAHRYETVMDEVRTGRMQADATALKVFFQCADHLSDLVRHSRDGGVDPTEQSNVLLARLDELLGKEAGAAEALPEPEIEFQPMGLSLDLASLEDGPAEGPLDLDALPLLDDLPELPPLTPEALKRYRLHFTPEPELFETGNV